MRSLVSRTAPPARPTSLRGRGAGAVAAGHGQATFGRRAVHGGWLVAIRLRARCRCGGGTEPVEARKEREGGPGKGEEEEEEAAAAEELEVLEEEAMGGGDEGRRPTDYDRRAHIFEESSRVFSALKHRHDDGHGVDGDHGAAAAEVARHGDTGR
ncbi:uncharacterized protein [Oryza sativa Japonica Group]|nr:uncharacterized protein LOC107277999 [Oryza sativa Japonica Group]XP_052150584.1 uncharacterized protein LOC127768955 [Oryza glaberrima]ABF95799.1 expressed protein [Oryza sativa Japonica Group]EAZ26824.1 hypothetical protein OsJ_10741 [Oryza sativa Japonica Group]KAF2939115.1 hypothetical protein DAI22_03g168600 [Oryza sativa Japonica Group]